MAKDRNGAPSNREQRYASDSEPESMSDSDEGSRRKSRSESKRKRKSRDDEEASYTSSSSASESDDYTDSYSDSESESGSSEDDRRRRKRWERKKREEEEERRRRRKEKERKRKRRKEKEEKEDRKRRKKKEKKKKKTKDKEKAKTGAVTNLWGKYGIIRETDMWNKRPEFTAWLAEVKKVNLESLPNWEEKQMFKQFMEDHNTATFPSKKYYNLDAYHMRKMEKEMKKGSKKARVSERTVFDDEEQRRQEMLRERERQKQEQVESLKLAMQSGMAQAMKEQAQLKEEMAYQYKIGNFEAAAAIQRRLDPDVAQ